MTATADKTSLKDKHLRNGDYFAIIDFFLHSILLKNYAKNGPVGATQNLKQRMKDLLLSVNVVVKTLNLEISRCRLADHGKECYAN